MTAPTLTIADFLLARIGDDEHDVRHGHDFIEEAESVRGPGWGTIDCRLCDFETFGGTEPVCEEQISEHLIDVHRAARVLAECTPKRVIVEAHPIITGPRILAVDTTGTDHGCETCHALDKVHAEAIVEANGACDTLRALASVYANHPDYRQEWAS